MRWSWWARLLTALSVPAMRLRWRVRWRLTEQRRAYEATFEHFRADSELQAARVAAEHEAQVRALHLRVAELRTEADLAVQTCETWRGLADDERRRHVAELQRGNRLAALLGAVANVADDPAMPQPLAVRIRGLAGRTWASETTPEQPNKSSDLRKQEDVNV